tara:strand:+ start:1977 stop:2270 length:294 start_codon:yes stop_codon:yes gene_type:complete
VVCEEPHLDGNFVLKQKHCGSTRLASMFVRPPVPLLIQPVARVSKTSLSFVHAGVQCVCPAIELSPAKYVLELADNGVLAMLGIWVIMVHAIYRASK